jgi:hypothetical protein
MELTVDPAGRARLRAAQRAFRGLPKDLRTELRKAQRNELGPIWRDEMATSTAHARRVEQHRVFEPGVRIKAGLPAYLVAGSSNKALSGGGVISDLARPEEFGTGRRGNLTRYRRRSPRGVEHTVTRHAARQLPTAKRSGWVVYPAVSQTIPRLIGVWVAGLTDRISRAIEGQ